MNFNIYVNKKIGESINKIAHDTHRSRNSIVTEALDEWLSKHSKTQWPDNFFDFHPIKDVPDFKAFRSDLSDITNEDPLA
jgi:hypothetical protein